MERVSNICLLSEMFLKLVAWEKCSQIKHIIFTLIRQCACVCAQSLQMCPTLCDSMKCSPPGSSVHGIPQAGILEWVAMSSSRGSSPPRNQTWVSCIGRQVLYSWATREAFIWQCIQPIHVLMTYYRKWGKVVKNNTKILLS